ncbi:hypothetical protein GW796_10250 [archaeon]|nr:hypothetical protein [archaeon]
MQEEDTDAVFSDKKLAEAKTYYQRLRLSLRFLTSNTYKSSFCEHEKNLKELKELEAFDFYNFVLKKTDELGKDFSLDLNSCEYKKALQLLSPSEILLKNLTNFQRGLYNYYIHSVISF